MLGVYSPDDTKAVALKGDYTVIGEYSTVYDRGYEIQTDGGQVWTRDKGIEMISKGETVRLTSETPLIADIWDEKL
ncbi:hypothetical protein [Paenibacillus marchantiophytorum]|uniref:hypothetical protein n=1 Tax=Paenibacillus marchantiophytorum TaxID=1619310 RepID=UPI0016665A96|nr:hypothetical protein [Paenibacillus marchantiophytorum]